MPIYEFRCTKCKKVHEMYQKHTEKQPPEKCDCDNTEFQQIITAAKVNKGPGWGGGKGNWVAIFAIAASLLLGGCYGGKVIPKESTEYAGVRRFENTEVICYVLWGKALQCTWKETR